MFLELAQLPLEFIETLQPGLVSVVVPFYNAERFLAETLQSVFSQTYSRIAIIVIDDGSTDGTADVVRGYSERVRAEFGPNRGVSAARNRGTALARGEFIQYLDADDLLVPDSIERRVAALQEPSADIAYSDWENLVEVSPRVFEFGERIIRQIEGLAPNPDVAKMKFWAPLAALTYRRTIVEKIGGFKEWLPIIQDGRFFPDACLLGAKIAYVSGVGAVYRTHFDASVPRHADASLVEDIYATLVICKRCLKPRMQ